MHNNYYFLRQLSHQLDTRLRGYRVVSCFTQNKDELVIEFNNQQQSFFIRASLEAAFCCLSFPENFSRARKNSVDLLPEIILKNVTGIRQYNNERCFSIALEGDLHLLFKMHGNRANIVLIKETTVVTIFRNHLKADFDIRQDQLDRTIDWSKDFFLQNQDRLKEIYFTFGKEIWTHLQDHGFNEADAEGKWQMIQQLLQVIEHPSFFIADWMGKINLLLFREGEVVKEFSDPLKAITEFYHSSISTDTFSAEKYAAMKQLQTKLDAGKGYRHKNQQRLDEILHDTHFSVWADIIMAHLHEITPGLEKITLPDFYNENKPIEIKLKKDLNAQKNAEAYYRKGKNQQIEIRQLQSSMEIKEGDMKALEQQLATIRATTSLKELRELTKTESIKTPVQENAERLPYHELTYKGFVIRIGKNAESNDKLTLRYSYKEDLWLHAKDVAGSHVLLKYQSGKNFPKDVVTYAAQLAAYYSKRKNETLCPVAVTPKKFVRKRKGDPAGTVVVEREEVLLVTPVARS